MGRHGENIRKRKDGRWEARMICRYDMEGKAVYRSVYGKSYMEAKEKRNALAGMTDNVYQCGQKITVKQTLEEWMESKKDMIKESTFVKYSSLLNRHIFPELGGYYLSAITDEQLNHFLRGKLSGGRIDGRGGLSAKTVLDIRSILLLGLEYARQQHYPCMVSGKIFSPPNRQPLIRILTREEQRRLEAALFSHPGPMELGILIALYGGLRIGEICALQWEDLNLTNGTISVNKTMMRISDLTPEHPCKTKILIDRPKTANSRRIIPLPTFLTAYLKEYSREGDAYILTGTKNWMEPRLCLKHYKKVLERAKLPPFTFHALRHTFATRCVENEFDLKSLSEILGHANVNTTLQRYIHPSFERKKEQMERLERVSIRGQNFGQ